MIGLVVTTSSTVYDELSQGMLRRVAVKGKVSFDPGMIRKLQFPAGADYLVVYDFAYASPETRHAECIEALRTRGLGLSMLAYCVSPTQGARALSVHGMSGFVVPRLPKRGPHHFLAESELLMARLVAEGWTNGEIGAHLGYTEGSVKNRLSVLCERFGVTTRSELVAVLMRERFIG